MSTMYRMQSLRRRRPPSRGKSIGLALLALLVGVGIFALAVHWFRRDVPVAVEEEAVTDDAAAMVTAVSPAPERTEIALHAVNGNAASGNAARVSTELEFSLAIVAALPPINPAETAYEAWFVKPGITDFFSLGEMYPREDGKWGLVWQQTRALVRNDIGEFGRVIIIREPRNGDTAPSTDHVLDGEF